MSKNYYITFIAAGCFRDTETVFLTSKNRTKHYNHKNDFETVFKFPSAFFKKHFFYDRLSGIYRTTMTFGAVKHYAIVRELP